MKNIIIIFLGLVCLASQDLSAQTIPGATKQPQWAMPFYFEDANGERDTVWIGYDLNAIDGIGGFDKEFNEWQQVDSNLFTAVVCPNCISPILHTKQPKDSAYKVDIQSSDRPIISIGFRNGKMPITMRWDNSYFYSDSLPFADISPKPRARADMSCGNSEPPYLYCYTGTPGYWFVLTDQPRPYFQKVFQDSFFFDGSGDMPAEKALNITIIIMPYDAHFLGLEETQGSKVMISPNPFSNEIHINISPLPDDQGHLIIQDLNGRVMWKGKSSEQGVNIIESSDWSNGIYILQYKTYFSILTYKLIKQ